MMLTLGSTVASVVFFFCMVWAVRGHFVGRAAPGMHVASAANAIAMVWFIVDRWELLTHSASVAPWRQVVAVGITLAALALFWWAIVTTRSSRLTLAFSADQPTFLVEDGPYAIVRHPFYTSYVLFWLGAAAGAASPLFWVVPIIAGGLYVRAAKIEESKFAGSTLAPRYVDYRKRTGLLMPRILPSAQSFKP